jgi:hypothetical protein
MAFVSNNRLWLWIPGSCFARPGMTEVLQIQHGWANHFGACQALTAKIFCFTVFLICGITPAVPRPLEGRFAIVTTRWARDAMAAAISGATAWFPKGIKARRRTKESRGR